MRVLQVVHGFPPAAAGGTEVYARALSRALAAAGDLVTVFTREADPSRAEMAVREESASGLRVVRVNNTFRDVPDFTRTYRNPTVRAAFAALLDDVRPEVVHLHHLTCLSTDLVLECAARGIPSVLMLHDYWLLCQRGQLLDLEYARCAGPTPAGCSRCLWLGAEGGAAIRERQAHIDEVLRAATLLQAYSRTLRDRFVGAGVPAERIRMHEVGVDPAPFAGARPSRAPGPLRVGFVGSLMISKAPHVLLEAVARLPAGQVEAHVVGGHAGYHGDDTYRLRLEPLLAAPGVHWHGSLPPDRVPVAMASLDVLVVPSTWIENSPFVIREAWLAGVPVVASDLGGMAELVGERGGGLLFPPGDAAALADVLRRFLDDPELARRLAARLPPVRTMEEDARETRRLYEAAGARG